MHVINIKNTEMNYQEFLEYILKKAASVQNESETHFLALRLIELGNSNSHLTTAENVNKFFDFKVKFLADEMYSQTLQMLKINSSYLNEKPRTGDFPSRYEAYKFTFKVLNDLPVSEARRLYAQSLETKINNLYQKNKSGCYIATMAYGDYDHPKVLILRQFRDNVLEKNRLGKWFIKSYYHCSPIFVEKLENKKIINKIIREALNQFIKIVK